MLAVASAAALLLIGAAGWGYERRAENAQHDQIAALVSDPATAHPLDDSELADQATGVVFVDPNGRDVYLIAHGLPALPSDQRYQVWLFTKESTRISAGLLQPAPNGEVRALLETPSPATDYVGLALSAEPIAGSAEPTSVMTLGGAL
jgi:anti-sigma-K factor RskA